MESADISKLASLLRESGDKVLNACSKLSLSSSLLQDINGAFASIVESDEDNTSRFQVIKTYNSKVDYLHDVQFLHDFVQKTLGLKLSHNPGNGPIIGNLDISKFRSLKFLELKKVPVALVNGIQGVRSRLQTLVCIKCIQKLEEILINCGADNSAGFTWSELREAVFNFNAIESLDASLEYTPWLQIIDLSHNRLRNVTALECLPNLKYLNLSYNLLESVPVFNNFACRKMQVLIIKNNYIEDISGLETLENLTELDLSCNCLTDHEGLVPLLRLSSLNWLSLEGNPLSFHSKHRSCTAHYLHRKAAFEKFVLDRTPLTKSERLLVGTASCSQVQQRALVLGGDNLSFRSGSSSTTLIKTQVPESLTAAAANKPRVSRKNRPVQEAVISENSESLDDETDTLTGSLEASYDHLETKRQIETLREQFGEDKWLVDRGGSCVQDVLGLPSGKPVDVTSTLLEAAEEKLHQVSSSPHASNIILCPNKSDGEKDIVHKEEDVSEQAKETCSEDQSEATTTEEEEREDFLEEDQEEDDDAEQQLYTVQRLHPGTQHIEELFLAVTDRYVKERDTVTGRTQERWSIDTLLSCLQICNSPVTVQLTFDTVRRDRQEREYIMEDQDAQNLVRALGNILDSRSLSAMNQIPYRCMKCSMQFSQEFLKSAKSALIPDPFDRKLTCPSCGSTMVIEMDEEPLPTQRPTKVNLTTPVAPPLVSGLAKSPSQSSIGQPRTPPGESLQVTAIVHQPDEPDPSPQQVPALTRSAASLESPNNNSMLAARRYDSDIEVISNPSQSSIEVLEGESRTPGRKRSSEERQTVVQSETAVNAQSVGQALSSLAGLTESSSSGSLTDSVCTTYEHQVPPTGEEKVKKVAVENGSSGVVKKPVEKTIEESAENVDKESGLFKVSQSPVKDFATMFEGLLQSVSNKLMGSASANAPTQILSSNSAIVYSYTDFSRVDHRIKLYLHQHILDGEELVLLLRASVLYSSASPFPGCLILSSSRVHVLKIIGSEGEDPKQWMVKVDSFDIAQLAAFFVLPWNQGVGLEIHDSTSKSILFLIQDQQWTSNLISFLNDSPLPKTCELRSEPPDYHQLALRELLLSSAPSQETDSPVRVLAIFNSCNISGEEVSKLGMGAIVVTASDLIVTQDDLQWLFPNNSAKSLTAHRAHKMNDLIEVELNGLIVILQFLDEAAGLEELWDVTLQTDNAVQTVIRAIQVPWEQLFSVPLQVTNKTEIVAT